MKVKVGLRRRAQSSQKPQLCQVVQKYCFTT
jgi:hypothetical protein